MTLGLLLFVFLLLTTFVSFYAIRLICLLAFTMKQNNANDDTSTTVAEIFVTTNIVIDFHGSSTLCLLRDIVVSCYSYLSLSFLVGNKRTGAQI